MGNWSGELHETIKNHIIGQHKNCEMPVNMESGEYKINSNLEKRLLLKKEIY